MIAPSTGRPHVVVVGAGFGGLNAVKALASADVDITVVDRRNFHLFQPLLYQVATATLSPGDIAHPIRSILRGQRNLREIRLGAVSAIDTIDQSIQLEDGALVDYDYLVVAVGASHNYFGHDDWAAHAPGLKSIEDALDIRRRIVETLEATERDGGVPRPFVVVGAGPTGVELAGAIADTVRHDVAAEYRRSTPATARIVLVDRAPRVLPNLSTRASTAAAAQLDDLGVEVRLGTTVADVGPDHVVLDDGTDIPAALVIWAAGIAASALARHLPAELDPSGRVRVGPDLSLPADRRVFVVGDLATIDGTPAVAPAAIQQGRHAARQIRRDIAGQPRTAFRYHDRGSLATIGRGRAVADLGRLGLSGRLAWVLWLVIHLAQLVGFRNRASVLMSWLWDLATKVRRPIRLITGSPSSHRGGGSPNGPARPIESPSDPTDNHPQRRPR
jgi:NADH dehydrogenase